MMGWSATLDAEHFCWDSWIMGPQTLASAYGLERMSPAHEAYESVHDFSLDSCSNLLYDPSSLGLRVQDLGFGDACATTKPCRGSFCAGRSVLFSGAVPLASLELGFRVKVFRRVSVVFICVPFSFASSRVQCLDL